MAHLHALLLVEIQGNELLWVLQRCGRKEVTNVQCWLLWARWAAIAMEVEVHGEAQKL